MSKLGQAVAEKLEMDVVDVDALLDEHHVSTTANQPAMSQLRIRRLRFTATKVLTGVDAAGVTVDPDTSEEVPVDFDWTLESGLQGVGSDKNLRGKSSVLRIIMWALRGRCDLRQDVRNWLDHVDVEFDIDTTGYTVVFDVVAGVPHGQLVRDYQGSPTPIGSFTTDAEFEEVMGSTMMSALRLPTIAAVIEGRRTQHTWPTYAGALLIRGDTLNNLLGEHHWSGLPSRLLQMFVGAEWAATRAEAVSAFKVAQAKLSELQAEAATHASAMGQAHQQALAAAEAAKGRIASLPPAPANLSSVRAAIARIEQLDLDISGTQRQLLAAQVRHAEVTALLAAEKGRQHQAMEDALAVRFFQQMRPTMCPRCSAPVTPDRRKAEAEGASCSVCTHDLDIHALAHDHVVSSDAADEDRTKFGPDHEETGDENEDDDADTVDALEALGRAVTDAAASLKAAEVAHQDLHDERGTVAQVIAGSEATQQAVDARREAELDLARAEGAVSVFAPGVGIVGPNQNTIEALRQDVKILDTTQKIVAKWVTDAQAQRLIDLGAVITELARSFGMVNLTAVELGGGATLKVTTGGATENYGECERGEKLRLKLATAIALIQQGRESGIGRHPGLLFVDSPGAEEVSDDDFDTMLGALHSAAADADIQVFIGTRHTQALLELLGEDRCRLGRGTNFVW